MRVNGMRCLRRLSGLIALVMWLWTVPGLASVTAQAPPLPHAFYGAVEAAGAPAPVGSQIEARAPEARTGVPGNPAFVLAAGSYGGAGLLDPKLLVQGEIPTDAEIEFYVNGVRAECAEPGGEWRATYPYRAGAVTQLNLRLGAPTTGGALPTATPTRTPTVTPSPFPTDPPAPTPELTPTPPADAPPTVIIAEADPTDALPTVEATGTAPVIESTDAAPATPAEAVAAIPVVAPPPTVSPTATWTSLPLERLPTAVPSPTPVLVAHRVATSHPILEPATPSPVPASAAPQPPPGQPFALWAGTIALALAIGLGLIVVRNLTH
jgi:hypothetical protein